MIFLMGWRDLSVIWASPWCAGIGVGSGCLAAGDFELAIYSVSTGRWGEF